MPHRAAGPVERHCSVVLIWLKHPESAADRAQLIRAAHSLRMIPGVLAGARPVGPCRRYRRGRSQLRSWSGDYLSRSRRAAALRKGSAASRGDAALSSATRPPLRGLQSRLVVRRDASFLPRVSGRSSSSGFLPCGRGRNSAAFRLPLERFAGRVEKVLKGAKAKIVAREKNDGAEVLDGRGTDPSGIEADTFYLQRRSATRRSNCNTNIRIGRWNITTIGWAKSGATSTRSMEPGV